MVDYYAAMDYTPPNRRPSAPVSNTSPMSTHHPHMSGPPRASRTQQEHRPSMPKQDRAGKFENLKGFLKQPMPDYSNYRNGVSKRPRPGQIIHITEEDDSGQSYGVRLHQRVMLVVRLDLDCAMTCIPFCHHDPSETEPEETHWNVLQDTSEQDTREHSSAATSSTTAAHMGTPATAAFDKSAALLVELKPGQFLDSDITINLTELWHVEYDHLSLDIIGRVSKQSWAPVIQKIVTLFTSSLMAMLPHAHPVPDIEVGSEQGSDAPLPAESVSGKHKSHGRKGNDARNQKEVRYWIRV